MFWIPTPSPQLSGGITFGKITLIFRNHEFLCLNGGPQFVPTTLSFLTPVPAFGIHSQHATPSCDLSWPPCHCFGIAAQRISHLCTFAFLAPFRKKPHADTITLFSPYWCFCYLLPVTYPVLYFVVTPLPLFLHISPANFALLYFLHSSSFWPRGPSKHWDSAWLARGRCWEVDIFCIWGMPRVPAQSRAYICFASFHPPRRKHEHNGAGWHILDLTGSGTESPEPLPFVYVCPCLE